MATYKIDQIMMVIQTGGRFKKRLLYRSGGALVDLAGASARMEIKDTALDADAVLTFASDTIDGPTITLNAEPGAIDFFASEADTGAIPMADVERLCVYDLKLTLPGEEPFYLLRGSALIQKGITT